MSVTKRDEELMAECLRLARLGKGHVSPNPLVGAIVVKGGEIVGRGYHRRFGEAHAERNALHDAGRNAQGATLYVNLEPCSHYGKTPPCTDAIISSGIRQVVVGLNDPNPLVKGRGIRALVSAGIKVREGVLCNECRELNEFFVKKMTTGLPFVTLKIAQTLDGRIAFPNRRSRWITSEESRKCSHELRAEYDAILIGANTVKLDNPRLTVRLVEGRNPKRILLDGNLSTPLSARLFSDSLRSQTIVFTRRDGNEGAERKKRILKRRGVEVVATEGTRDGTIDLRRVLKSLAAHDILSVLVEGGQCVFTEFLESGLVDRLLIFVAPKVYGPEGVPTFGNLRRFLSFTPRSMEQIGNDVLMRCEVQKET
jgi:diaminohydroxyphosphoribosylaminopyrimidine deaminase/5-amino-6-(5-phosphoribosylamino)uracil reductase